MITQIFACMLLSLTPEMKEESARISHQLSNNSHTLSPHLDPQQGGSVLHEHCPRPTVSQSAATGERFVLRSDEKYGLVIHAKEARTQAYCPYSNYQVGAALLTDEGEIIRGCNVENASYGLTMCAERAAVFSAVSQGKKNFAAIAVVTKDGGTPCGGCRQVLNEFNPKIAIIIADENGTICKETTLEELLPDAFGPHNLE